MFFSSYAALARVLVVGTLAYALLIVLLRVSGKRTLSKMNVFDFLVTIALGSTLATILLSRDVVLAEGLVAFAVLIVGQYLITFISARSPAFQRLIKSEPTLLLHEGRFLEGAMRRERVTRDEVLATLREHGYGSVEGVRAVILETEGSFSVVGSSSEGNSALATVGGAAEEPTKEEPTGVEPPRS